MLTRQPLSFFILFTPSSSLHHDAIAALAREKPEEFQHFISSFPDTMFPGDIKKAFETSLDSFRSVTATSPADTNEKIKGKAASSSWTFPARPSFPILQAQVPHSRTLSVPSTVYILHTLAHVELNAVEMYLDTIVRFSARCHPVLEPDTSHNISTSSLLFSRSIVNPFLIQDDFVDLGPEFDRDMISIVEDEARHFNLVAERLLELSGNEMAGNMPTNDEKTKVPTNSEPSSTDFRYGCIPATTLLWQLGVNTRSSLPERLAVIPLSQEARGLDAAPRFEAKIISSGDSKSAQVVAIIGHEEKRHVHLGLKWFAASLEPFIDFSDESNSEQNNHENERRPNGENMTITDPANNRQKGKNDCILSVDWTPYWGAAELQAMDIDPYILVNKYGQKGSFQIGEKWKELVSPHFPDGMFPPFNVIARSASGIPSNWYIPLCSSRVPISYVTPHTHLGIKKKPDFKQ